MRSCDRGMRERPPRSKSNKQKKPTPKLQVCSREQPVSVKVTLQQALKSQDQAARTQLGVFCQKITLYTEQHPHLSGDFDWE